MLNLIIAIIIENFEFHSVKNDLVRKLDNLDKEKMYENMTIRERILSFLCNIEPKRSLKKIKDDELAAE